MLNRFPKVSFIIPVFNEEKNIKECLDNLFQLEYPSDKLEVFIIDGGSTDNTLEIAKKYSCIILNNPYKIAPKGKGIGLKKATGELIYFHEADVRFDSREWLAKMVQPILEREDIFGVECDWGVVKNFTSFNTYCTLLKIADPMARLLSIRTPRKVTDFGHYRVEEYEKNANPIMFSFLWKKEIIDRVGGWEKEFAEANFFSRIISNGNTKFAHINNAAAYHYYINSFSEFARKRKKIAKQFLERKLHEESWADKRSFASLFFASLYLVSIVGPLTEATYNFIKTKKIEWFWHPLACFTTVTIYTYFYLASLVKHFLERFSRVEIGK